MALFKINRICMTKWENKTPYACIEIFLMLMIAPCRLGIDEELVALLGKHSPVSIQPLILFSPVNFRVATNFSNCLNIIISEGLGGRAGRALIQVFEICHM